MKNVFFHSRKPISSQGDPWTEDIIILAYLAIDIFVALVLAKRARTKNRMQMIIPSTRLIQHQRILRELEGIQAKFSFEKCVLRTPAVLETVLGKSSAILVCLSESCLRHDVTRALCYCMVLICLASRARFWYSDLWVMSALRFHCATLLTVDV